MPFDFDAAVGTPFRMQPGLRKLAPGTRQFTPLAADHPARAEKLAVLMRHPGEALLCADGFDPLPALRELAAEAARQCPQAIAADDHGVSATQPGWRADWNGRLSALRDEACPDVGACLAALPASQRVAGLLSLTLHEDLAIVDGATATLPWMAVCLPSHWAPRDKCGRSFASVHDPVADNAVLIAAGRHLMQLVCQPQRWERFVWTITTHDTHDQHPDRHARQPWASTTDAVAAQACWRTEHQTFVPLPALQQAVFTIHVEVRPLALAIATPGRAAALHGALASMSEAVLAYRGLAEARASLLAWLECRAAS